MRQRRQSVHWRCATHVAAPWQGSLESVRCPIIAPRDSQDCWEECEVVLCEFLHDEDEVIRQSCEVALDAAEYFGRMEPEPETDSSMAAEMVTVQGVGSGGSAFAREKAMGVGAHFNLAAAYPAE
eukprot:SAG11_NODE_2029_length_3902_cov_2.613463_5_plen_125_part_00